MLGPASQEVPISSPFGVIGPEAVFGLDCWVLENPLLTVFVFLKSLVRVADVPPVATAGEHT